ncbi:adrenocorticotropic hormone receptor-like [Amphibalanus amphitrite]|uniref:adrenocorticotropic hormone receptor-like n=1 Tax=Amphibalanus amphitrite TaxID=1232801 RepID=UPI001C8FF230|nr:adrenocorticotropic hormone receptor-like [Amphibalanus amphitrite]
MAVTNALTNESMASEFGPLHELLETSNGTVNETVLRHLLALHIRNQLRQGELEHRRNIYLITVPIMLVFCVIGTVINLSICVSARLIRRPLSPTMCFSVSLAGADAYAASILGLGLVVNSLLPVGFGVETLSRCPTLVLEALRLGGVISTAAHLLALALNHYVGILRPLHYARLITRGRVLTSIGFLWLVPILFFLVYFAAAGGFRADGCSLDFLPFSTFRRVVASLFFVPLICMFFAYTHIFIMVRQHQRGSLRNQNSSQLKSSVKAVVTTLLILGTYILCWMPAVVTFILICYDCSMHPRQLHWRTHLEMAITTNTLVVLKCLVDPVIYAARMPEIKLALRRLRQLLLCRPGTPGSLQPGRNTRTTLLAGTQRGLRTTTTAATSLRQNGHTEIPLRVLRSAGAPQPVQC